jgi:putative flippase GtrA
MLPRVINYAATHRVQLARFVFVGFLTFGINISCFHFFYGLLAYDYKVAVSLAYLMTLVSHFFLHRFFTFAAGEQALIHHTWRYLLMLGLNYILSISVVWITVEIAGISPYFGVVASTGVTAFSSFFVMKHFVFREGKAAWRSS